MRIPLLERIRIKHAIIFATVLFIVEQVEHTEMLFAALTFVFILISTVAFNAAGGLPYPSGWFVFSNAVLTALVGLCYKALLGEAAQTHLQMPDLTMLTYCISMLLMFFVAVLTRKLRPRDGLLAGIGLGEGMKKAALGALLVGVVLQVLSYGIQENGSILSALRQINFFTQMGVMLGTFYEVRKSNGERSTNWIVWAGGIFMFVFGGIFSFSKQGLLTPMLTWLISAVAAGHTFRRKQILLIVGSFILFQTYLVPYSQVGRNLRLEDGAISDDIKVAANTLAHISEVRGQFLDDQRNVPQDDERPHFFDRAQGFFDRLNMLSPDDALISYTAQGNEEGLLPTWWAILNVIPHFVWKDKPFYFTGNLYAREIGMIADDNEGTGVSFSPVGDAYHQASFFGVFLLLPPVFFFVFIIMDSLSGDIRKAPWGILFCVVVAHMAPEGAIGGQVYVGTYIAFGVVLVALMSRYVLPVVSGVITNADRTRVRRTVDFKPFLQPRSQPIVPRSEPRPENP